MSRKSLFPQYPLNNVLQIARTIWEHNAGNPTRRVAIFDILKRQPDSGASRSLITASSKYGLTVGSYNAEVIKLTDRGRSIVAQNDSEAKLDAVLQIDIFRSFFEKYRDAIMPNRTMALDFLKEQGISDENAASNCLDIIFQNGKDVGLIREYSGKERILSPEHALEEYRKEHKNGNINANEDKDLRNNVVKEMLTDSLDNTHGVDNKDGMPTQVSEQVGIGRNRLDPALHIDIQIHISADAKPEQIDQIFASMAKHLYNRD